MMRLINSGFSNRSIVRQVLTALALTISSAIALAENPPLIEAARYQDAAAVRLVLATGADPEASQSDGATALHWAVYQEDADMLAALVQAGANVNITNRLGASPLYLAAKNGNAELIEGLLNAGADPNLTLPMGETPLMTAARSGTVEGVQQMIAAGANVNANEKTRRQTALMWAVAQGHVDVARALINAGANLEARSKVRPRLVYVEATNGYAFDPGIVEQMGGYSPLLFAAARGQVEVGQLLIRSGVDVNGVAGNGASPLVVATHSGHPDFARLLLSAGADPDAIGAGYNALHAAALRGDLETVEALLKYGANPDVRLKRPTPGQRASEDWALKTPLVSATPYWLAASFREAKIMSALEHGGANPLLTTEETFYGKGTSRADRLNPPEPKPVDGFASAVQAAIRGDSTRQRFNTIPNPDPLGEERLTLEAVIVAAEHGVNLNHFDFNESTALHYAAARNLPTVVRELAERGADINALNGEGQTPLDVAIIMENTTDFFNFDLRPKPGPKPSEVLVEFGAIRSDIEGTH